MKTFIKSALAVCIALTTLVGCSTEDVSKNKGNGEKTVRIKLSTRSTRAAGQHINNETAVTMNDAAIYFASGTTIVTMYEILETGGDLDEGTVNQGALESGVEFTNLPASVDKVYVFGNLPGGTYPTSGNITTLFNVATKLTLASQTDEDGGVANVSLYGVGDVVLDEDAEVAEGENEKHKATVNVVPVVARFEIGTIEATYEENDPFTSTVKSFSLDGIYLDNYYATIGFDGTAGTLMGISNDPDDYPGEDYADEMMDESGFVAMDGVAGYISQTIDPDGENQQPAVWSYNLLAATGAKMPSIVVKISEVVITTPLGDDSTTYAGEKFFTVRNIYEAGTTNIQALEAAGSIKVKKVSYHLEAIEFEFSIDPEKITGSGSVASRRLAVNRQIEHIEKNTIEQQAGQIVYLLIDGAESLMKQGRINARQDEAEQDNKPEGWPYPLIIELECQSGKHWVDLNRHLLTSPYYHRKIAEAASRLSDGCIRMWNKNMMGNPYDPDDCWHRGSLYRHGVTIGGYQWVFPGEWSSSEGEYIEHTEG